MDIDGQNDTAKRELPEDHSTIAARLEALESLPHRSAALHWAAFTLSLLSLILLLAWVLGSRGSVPRAWVLLDIGLGVLFTVEFFTRRDFAGTGPRTGAHASSTSSPSFQRWRSSTMGLSLRECGYGSSWWRAQPERWIGFSGMGSYGAMSWPWWRASRRR